MSMVLGVSIIVPNMLPLYSQTVSANTQNTGILSAKDLLVWWVDMITDKTVVSWYDSYRDYSEGLCVRFKFVFISWIIRHQSIGKNSYYILAGYIFWLQESQNGIKMDVFTILTKTASINNTLWFEKQVPFSVRNFVIVDSIFLDYYLINEGLRITSFGEISFKESFWIIWTPYKNVNTSYGVLCSSDLLL